LTRGYVFLHDCQSAPNALLLLRVSQSVEGASCLPHGRRRIFKINVFRTRWQTLVGQVDARPERYVQQLRPRKIVPLELIDRASSDVTLLEQLQPSVVLSNQTGAWASSGRLRACGSRPGRADRPRRAPRRRQAPLLVGGRGSGPALGGVAGLGVVCGEYNREQHAIRSISEAGKTKTPGRWDPGLEQRRGTP
jgi:hypothetical protein